MFLIQILASQLVCEQNLSQLRPHKKSAVGQWTINMKNRDCLPGVLTVFDPDPDLQKSYIWSPTKTAEKDKVWGWSGKTRQRRLISSDSVSLIRVLTSLWWNQFPRAGLPNPNPLITFTGQEPKAEDQKLQELQMLSGPVRMVTHVSNFPGAFKSAIRIVIYF